MYQKMIPLKVFFGLSCLVYWMILTTSVDGYMALNSNLKVNFPEELVSSSGYDHREALFGVSPYGGTIQASLYYLNDPLCTTDNIDLKNVFPKKADGSVEPTSPFVYMIDRGDCTFVQKVRYAQHNGAVGVLIADNICICGDATCIVTPGTKCETQEPIMADDGSGGDITIPSFLMYKKDADKFIDMLKTNNRPVQIEMSWSMPNPDARVEYDLWTTPLDSVTRDFLLNWAPVAKALGERAYFTPHMYIYDGIRAGCQTWGTSSNSSVCNTLCTNGGRYCGTDPDDDLTKGISGADVVNESLRRICLWHDFGAPNGIGEKWWDYVTQFMTTCSTSASFTDANCIEQIYKNIGIDGARVNSCMKDSGTGDNSVNTKLEEEVSQQTKRGIVIIPSAFVNNAPIRGALTVPNVFQAICAGFAEGTAPKICYQCSSCADVPNCINRGVCRSYQYSSSTSTYKAGGGDSDLVSFGTFFFWMVLLVGTLATAGVIYKNRTEETMRSHVRTLLADYMPLQDQDGDPTNNGYHHNGGASSMMMSTNGFIPNGHNSGMMSSQQSQQYYPQQQQQQYAQPQAMMQQQYYGDIHNGNHQYSAPIIPPTNNTNSQMTSLLS